MGVELEIRKFLPSKKKYSVCVAQVGKVGLSFNSKPHWIQGYLTDDEPDEDCTTLSEEPILFSKEVVLWQ